eukprot:7276768-Ditylum_brightwellii.AAC.1
MFVEWLEAIEDSFNSLLAFAMASPTNNCSRGKAVENVNACLMGVEGFLGDIDINTLGMDCLNISVATKELVAMARVQYA